MPTTSRHLLENWTVDYGGGHVESVTVPHAWRQDVPVSFVGPVVYRTELDVPRKPSVLRFHGISYRAEVSVDGEPVSTHEGIWDAFDVPLDGHRGKRVVTEVKVVKNGGPTYPVRDVASGFLPYVFHTFGGIHGEVELLDASSTGYPKAAPSRVCVERSKIFVDGEPFYVRGLLTWGWYPEVGHTNPPDDTIRSEVRAARSVGFNLIKFCLWVPSHRYLEILREEGMFAWIELPLWDPSSDASKLQRMSSEIERVLRQYRHHDNVICWTAGCELGAATPPEYRQRLVQLIKNLTGCPLVKDNSGGAEMYGGDLREFGDFDDFHPYCEPNFYPVVLDSLLPGPRPDRPVLLGEFNDIDVHRDLARLSDELPFWMSGLPELNAQGVRWQHEMPAILTTSRFALEPRKSGLHELMESSRRKAVFIRKFVHETVRAREPIAGYVVTGIRDTPISSSGAFDDWGKLRFSPHETLDWNGDDVLFQIPVRRPPWVRGGNRPGWLDGFNSFCGQIFVRIGLHSMRGCESGLVWRIESEGGETVAEGAADRVEVTAFEPREVAQISWICDRPGSYMLFVEFAGTSNHWPLNVFDPPSETERKRFAEPDFDGLEFRSDKGTLPMPFWREAAYQFAGPAWGLAERWERLLPISPDCALDPASLPSDAESVILRIDSRTYVEHPIAVRAGRKIITTLRPWGGLGVQPSDVLGNPSGVQLLRDMLADVKEG